jgi:cyclic pyranopterin phosphate synthase
LPPKRADLTIDEYALKKLRLLEDVQSAASSREGKILEIIGMAVKRKKAKHDSMGQLEETKNPPMILNGG